VTTLLFDRDNVEEVAEWPPDVRGLGRSSVMWIDLDRPPDGRAGELAEALGLTPETRDRLADGSQRPQLSDHAEYLHVSALAPARNNGQTALVKVDCLVARSWVVTVHEGPIPVLDDFRERASGSGETGRLDGLQLLANLLEWVLTSYLEAFEDVELALEKFDTRAMKGNLDETEAELGRLVEHRHEVGRLRRALTSHREIFLALTRPELGNVETKDHRERFESLRSQLEDAVQAARDSRESVVGSFDVLIARTEQKTNEIMKVLTLASVLLLPGALIAGVLGMNFKVGLFTHAWVFWVAVAGIAGLAAATLAAARARHWI
jgi:Mg2+ and Co2+ transporter CorA